MGTSGRIIASARLIAALTLGSRVLGLVRECLFSYYFSTSQLLSAFRIAFMVPNLARRLFGEGALASAMIPVLTESIQTRGEEASRRFVGTLLTVLFIVLGGAVVVFELAIALGRAVRDDPALELGAILLPYLPLVCALAVAGAVLNVRGHFAAPAAAPMLLNVGIIVGALSAAVGGNLRGLSLMYAICAGVLVAGVVQVLLTGVVLRAIAFFPVLGGSWRDSRLRAVGLLMAPMILGLSAVQINTLVDYLIAYLFVTHNGQRVGPAVLGYAQYLYQLPLGVFGIGFATAIFPVLSQQAATGDRAGLAETLAQGIRLSLFIALPASVGLILVAKPLVATIFQRGAFDAADTTRVAGTLVFYSLGLAAYFTQHLLARAFYALKNSKTPARIALCMVGMNFVMNVALVFALEERGLALATAICAGIQVLWLAAALTREMPAMAWGPVRSAAVRMAAATAIMAGVLVLMGSLLFTDRLVGAGPAIRLVGLVFFGTATYGLSARLLRIEELGALLSPLRAGRGRGDGENTLDHGGA